MMGFGGGVGCVVASEGQEKVTVHTENVSNHRVKLGYNELPVDIEMTGAACVNVFKTPLLPTE